jgi:hypothetical protein
VPVTVYVVVVVGETVTDEPDKLPGFHTYVEAPLALNEVLPPTQIAEFAELAVTVGNGLTVIVRVAVPTQPADDVPVTVYVVVVVGDTVTDEPDKLPGFHTYVEAPLALNEVLPPTQIAEFAELAVTVGNGFTVIVRVAVPTQPADDVPVTVYVVVVVGDTVTDEPDRLPGFHT